MKKKTLFVATAATSSFTAFLIFYSIAATALSESGTITNIQNGPDGRQEEKVSGTWNLIAFRY